jgi:hypothetical protein
MKLFVEFYWFFLTEPIITEIISMIIFKPKSWFESWAKYNVVYRVALPGWVSVFFFQFELKLAYLWNEKKYKNIHHIQIYCILLYIYSKYIWLWSNIWCMCGYWTFYKQLDTVSLYKPWKIRKIRVTHLRRSQLAHYLLVGLGLNFFSKCSRHISFGLCWPILGFQPISSGIHQKQ